MMMKKTIVYIDGFNLYYGLLRFSQNKWLDVVMFAKSLLPRLADLPTKCQLPDVIPVGTHGRTIHRPAAWAAPATA